MAANPVILPIVLAVISAFNGYFKWDDVKTFEGHPHDVPVWWDINAHPIYFLPRWVGFSLLPALMVIIPYIIYVFACYDRSIELQSGEPKHASAHLITLPALFFFVVHNFVILHAFTDPTGILNARFLVASIALSLMIWAGYNLQYVTPNHTVGILTPWTLREQSVWIKTHTHAAWILIVFGVALLVCAFFVPLGLPLLIVTLVLWLGSDLYLGLYSWAVSSESPTVTLTVGRETEPLLPQ